MNWACHEPEISIVMGIVGQVMFTLGFFYGDNLNSHSQHDTDFGTKTGNFMAIAGMIAALVSTYFLTSGRGWYFGYRRVFKLLISLMGVYIFWGLIMIQYTAISVLLGKLI